MLSENILGSVLSLVYICLKTGAEYYGINISSDSTKKLEPETKNYSSEYNKGADKNQYIEDNLFNSEKGYNDEVAFDFDKSGYDIKGIDRGKMSSIDYVDEVIIIGRLLQSAHFQMKKKQFGYALHDIRIGLEKGVKCIILHWLGETYIKGNLDDNITVCKNHSLLSNELVNQLYAAKKHCNDMLHDTNIKKEYRQVHFTYKVLVKLNDEIKSFI